MISVRDKILNKLKKLKTQIQADNTAEINEKRQEYVAKLPQWSESEKISRLKNNLINNYNAEVYETDQNAYLQVLEQIITAKGIQALLYAPDTDLGQSILQKRKAGHFNQISLVAYNKNIEDFKELLFQVDAAVTTSKGAIADTGSLIFWPTKQEPRLMSLVPPIHIALLDKNTIYNSFSEAVIAENWQDKLPSNALLISGPSKTADIEFVLTLGVHGPKEFIVVLIN